jgi:molybdopterin synthase sulfur carrier subunit
VAAVCAGTLAVALAAASGDGGSGGADQRDERNARLRAILVRSSFLVDGTPVGTRAPEAVPLGDGSVVEVLPPFAGG